MHTDAHIADLRSLSRLLDAALDVGAASMDAWLQALPPADRHLAPRLREMLAGHWSGTASTPMAAFPTCNDCPSEPSPRAGDRVGPFRLLREIGRGGMSRVWLAGPVKGTAQHVALKLSRSAPDGRYAQRLADEGGITALMDHQNIVRLLDTGVDHHQRPYLVLEHVPGLSLRDWCRSTASGVPGLLRVFVQLAQALAHVHGRGVVHRDLKPSNVLVGDDGQVHLIDFGIATRHDFATGMADARMPDAGTAALAQRGMTPAYASPEQLRGDATGFASDVYSLVCCSVNCWRW